MTQYLPSNFSIKNSSSKSSPATASVEVLQRELSLAELPKAPGQSPETWFARTSLHENQSANGTADWSEFESGLLDDHSQHEMDYTPDVFDAHKVLTWDSPIEGITGYDKVAMGIVEMAHKIPPPLNNRVFSVLILTARSTSSPQSFLVIQIPVNISKLDKALYSNGRHKNDGDSAIKKKDALMGEYVSIERCELVEDGKKVKWQMATASDAKGNLPGWAQKMAVPGTVVKDVGLFIDWVQKQRKK